MLNSRYRLMLCASILASSLFAKPADAQYREGQPPTLTPVPKPPSEAARVATEFSAASLKAGSPRIVIFWNKDFTDEVASEYSEVAEYSERKTVDEIESEEETAGPAGNMRIRERNLDETTRGRSSVGDERVTAKRDKLVDEAVDWDLEGAFNAMLIGAGANLVDRASIMRTQGVQDGAEERANVQAIETRAVTGKADVLVEILRTPDKRATDGISFRIVARDINKARLLADFTTSGRPPTPRMGLVAGPSGFERAAAAEPGPLDIGRQLAVEVMQALVRNWR